MALQASYKNLSKRLWPKVGQVSNIVPKPTVNLQQDNAVCMNWKDIVHYVILLLGKIIACLHCQRDLRAKS